jgi:hypothetical protein
MSRVRGARLKIDHLLRITVVGRYDQGVPCLLACLVDRTDGRVGVGDGLDSRLKDTRMADLGTSKPSINMTGEQGRNEICYAPYLAARSCT